MLEYRNNTNYYSHIVGIAVIFILFIFFLYNTNHVYIQAEPYLMDDTLKIETVYEGLDFPVSMSFLGKDDIMVLEKNQGTVHRIVNGQMIQEPMLKIDVDKDAERGLLGSTVGFDKTGKMKVFLYFTQSNTTNLSNSNSTEFNTPKNYIYKYDIIDGKLGNPQLLFSVPTNEIPIHNGGKMIIGPDNNLYVLIGDIAAWRTITQNIANGTEIDGTGGIIRMNMDGLPVDEIIGNNDTEKYYFAYGIRNGFGMDFDPVTGNLWDTENGQNYGDEINLVLPGFNSGWNKVQGVWEPKDEEAGQPFFNKTELVKFNNNTNYSSPEVTWLKSIGLTSIKFLNSTKLGENYKNDIFVGDFNYGNLYHFSLNDNRTKIIDDSFLSYNISFGNEEILVMQNDPLQNCNNTFSCYVLSDDLSNNLHSKILMITTPLELESLSTINGDIYDITPNDRYKITTYMKLNDNAQQSNLLIQGYSEETKLWIKLKYCPSGIDGPIDWIEFTCVIDIPNNVTKLLPTFNGGYSSEAGIEAITWFRNVSMEKDGIILDLFPSLNQTSNPLMGRNFGHITDIQVGPDGNLYILSISNEKREALMAFDGSENDYRGSIYRITK